MIGWSPGHIAIAGRPPDKEKARKHQTRELERPGRLRNKGVRVVLVQRNGNCRRRCTQFNSLQYPKLAATPPQIVKRRSLFVEIRLAYQRSPSLSVLSTCRIHKLIT